ncbi:MAG TPA: hypothetical protein VGI61_04525 [Parafilimonas sp.]
MNLEAYNFDPGSLHFKLYQTKQLMSYDEFILTIENDEPPSNFPLYIQSLWWDAKGDWPKAHTLIDSLDDKDSCLVHAYLHRKEGDISNADYWYRRAQKTRPSESLQAEWKTIAMELLLKS